MGRLKPDKLAMSTPIIGIGTCVLEAGIGTCVLEETDSTPGVVMVLRAKEGEYLATAHATNAFATGARNNEDSDLTLGEHAIKGTPACTDISASL